MERSKLENLFMRGKIHEYGKNEGRYEGVERDRKESSRFREGREEGKEQYAEGRGKHKRRQEKMERK